MVDELALVPLLRPVEVALSGEGGEILHPRFTGGTPRLNGYGLELANLLGVEHPVEFRHEDICHFFHLILQIASSVRSAAAVQL